MKKKYLIKLIGIVSGLMGLTILFYVAYPIVAYEVISYIKYPNYLLPVPGEQKYIYSKEEAIDFTKPENWFNGEEPSFDVSNVKYYTVTIPKLKIKNATVSIGGEDLSESLIQYPGTALPGRVGNTVIFGHSVLPQFFDPKDYLTIFSTLPKLRESDQILVDFDGINYEYVISDIFEVGPTDVEILSQSGSEPYLTLVTCVPPGHPLRPKRLIVRAKLVPVEERKIYELSRS